MIHLGFQDAVHATDDERGEILKLSTLLIELGEKGE